MLQYFNWIMFKPGWANGVLIRMQVGLHFGYFSGLTLKHFHHHPHHRAPPVLDDTMESFKWWLWMKKYILAFQCIFIQGVKTLNWFWRLNLKLLFNAYILDLICYILILQDPSLLDHPPKYFTSQDYNLTPEILQWYNDIQNCQISYFGYWCAL